ncbi:MAG: hypothetical protein RJB66_319 [Pseudomonadota bacterium]|jgi:1-acyl-sn-glycerol-3-phosphate acyltransferase
MNPIALIRSALVALIYPVVILFFSIIIVFLGAIPGGRSIQDKVVGWWARFSLWLFGVDIEVIGEEKIPLQGYIGLFNHTSNFDILAVQSVINRIRFGAKIELFRIPVFGQAMRAARALPIARARREEVIKVYDEAKLRLRAGECFILSPEGTRQSEERLGAFKSGPFLFAISAQVPLLPIGIKGASKIQPKKSLLPNVHHWKSKIEIRIGDPIETIGLTSEDKADLQEKVRLEFFNLGLQ